MDFLSWFALVLLIFVICTLVYGMIAIHDIPYNIAKKRNHPHQDAIHYGGWISLFTLHAIWPFLWIWAAAYHPVYGYKGIPRGKENETGGEKSDEPTSLEADLSKSGRHRSE
jgi:hypothetical protein